MNILKKTLSLALALSLLAGLLIPASAARITLGQEQRVTIVDDETPVVFEFVPAKTGHYGFYSYNAGNYDPYGYIMDADRELLVSGDDTENGSDFFIVCQMTAGKTYYLAATTYSGSAAYSVQIKELVSPTSMSFVQDRYVGNVRQILYPQVKFSPAGCIEEEVTYTSSNEQVATVIDFEDLYLGLPGTATITATSSSGLTATCTVTVAAPSELALDAAVTLDAAQGEKYLQFVAPEAGWYGIYSAGDEVDCAVEVLDQNLEGIVSDEGTLLGDPFFAPFYLEKDQLCYFGISFSSNTGLTQVTVQKLAPATSITLPQDRITGYADTVCQLQVAYGPEYSIPEALTWKSSNEDVVYVDENGCVSYLQPGKATITVTSETGKTDSVTVTVLNVPTGIAAWGICGPNLQWQLNASGVLTITGTGEMYDLYDNDCHWDAYSDQIKQVIFPEGITHIGYGAFLYCDSLTEVVLPDSIRTIGASAFSGCASLSRVKLPKNLERMGSNAFELCYTLEEIVLPDTLTRIPFGAFSNCLSLQRVTLPKNLVAIGDQAFSGCSFETIALPDSLKTLGFSAFAGTGLTRIQLPEGLTELRDYAFVNCYLEELTLPSTITKLGCSFVSGNDLTTLRFLGNAPVFDQYALDYLNITAYYPAGDRTWTEAVMQNYGGTVTWVAEGDPGVTLSGTAAKGAVLTLSQGETVLETVTVEGGSYCFYKLQPGIYTLTASATNHVTRTYSLTVTAEDLTQDVKLHLIGDIDGNGFVNMGDVSILYAHIKGSKKQTDEYRLLVANINGGSLNLGDFSTLYAHITGTKKLY